VKLYLMRHGPAEDQAESGRDEDRALTSSGRERVRRVAKALLGFDEAPARIISSPLVRAVQTAEIMASEARNDDRGNDVEVGYELRPGGPAASLIRSLTAARPKRVMLVGHEPDLSRLAESFLGPFKRSFDKAMVIGLRLDSPGAHVELRFVLDPNTLRMDPDARTV
jgi:phosphohistidine phosphatase